MSEITGVGFYESLNKFFVGFLILVLFVGLNSDLFINPLFLISAYIVGCIYQAIIQVLTESWLSLQKTDIKKVYNEVNENKNKNKKEPLKDQVLAFMKDQRRRLCLISRLCACNKLKSLLCIICRRLSCNRKRDKFSKDKEAYLKAYYKVAKAGLLMNIPVLEALENFMRNLILIMFFYILFFIRDENCNAIFCKTYPLLEELFPSLWGDSNSMCIYKTLFFIFLILVWVGVIWLRYYYQQTIYRLVWEGNKYLDKIDQDYKLEERKIRREMLKNRHFFFFRCKTRL